MNTKNSKILLVAVPKRIEELFQAHRLSYSVLTASDSIEAFSSIESEQIKLCILSDDMQHMEEFIKNIRSSPWGAELPLLVITSTKTHEELFKLGADAFFGTSETDSQFLEKIELLLGLSESGRSNIFFKRNEQDNPFDYAWQFAAQMVSGFESATPVELERILSSRQTLQSLVVVVEEELRGHEVGQLPREIPEGLEAIDPQAYIGHQLSVGERMESDKRDSSYDFVVNSTSRELGIEYQDEGPSEQNQQSFVSEPISAEGDVTQILPEAIKNKRPTVVEGFGSDCGTLNQSFATRKVDTSSEDDDTLPKYSSPPLFSQSSSLSMDKHENEVPIEEDYKKSLAFLTTEPETQEQRAQFGVEGADDLSELKREKNTGENDTNSFVVAVETVTPLPGSKDMRTNGNLEEIPFWQVIVYILSHRSTGTLVVRRRGVERKVYCNEGQVLLVNSNSKQDRLVELLYREGRISDSQYDNASLTIAASGRRAGVVMIEKGIIGSRELFPIVRYHYESLLYDLFSWTEGDWEFIVEPFAQKERIVLDVVLCQIVMEAFRSSVPADQIRRLLDEQSKVQILNIDGLEELKLEFSPVEESILEWCNGHRTTLWLAKRFEVEAQQLMALLAGLVAMGVATVKEGAGISNLANSQLRFELAEDTSVEETDIARINDKYLQVEEGTYFDIFEVAPNASVSEIKAAYQRLKGLYAPAKHAGIQLSDLQEKLCIIGSVLDEARDVLLNDQLRRKYQKAIIV